MHIVLLINQRPATYSLLVKNNFTNIWIDYIFENIVIINLNINNKKCNTLKVVHFTNCSLVLLLTVKTDENVWKYSISVSTKVTFYFHRKLKYNHQRHIMFTEFLCHIRYYLCIPCVHQFREHWISWSDYVGINWIFFTS
jgi:hypothetical protein